MLSDAVTNEMSETNEAEATRVQDPQPSPPTTNTTTTNTHTTTNTTTDSTSDSTTTAPSNDNSNVIPEKPGINESYDYAGYNHDEVTRPFKKEKGRFCTKKLGCQLMSGITLVRYTFVFRFGNKIIHMLNIMFWF